MTSCMVAVEDDFTGNSSTTVSTAHQQQTPISSNFEMNPQQSSASYGHGPGPGFYGQPGPHFPGAGPGGPGQGYPGPMSPYGGPGPMSPYANQNQGPANGAGGGSMYGNQNNSPLYNNQNQSSSGYGGAPGGGPGNYTTGAGLAGYYNNHSPTHSSGHQYHQSPPPQTMGMMQLGARIPQPQNMNSPNQNVVTSNQMKTENMDLKPGPGMYSGQSVSQGYSQSSYGYNGYSGRPLVSPRLNISPGGPNHSPREVAPPNMSPHPGLYQSGQQQASPGPASFPGPGQPQHPGSYQAQYEATYFKPGGQAAQHSPGGDRLGYPGGEADKLSDAQSNAGSVRSGDGPDTPAHSSFCDDTSNPILTNLLPKKEAGGGASDTKPDNDKLSSGADSDIENKFTPKSEPDEIKPEGSYYEELTLKANQTLIDNMNIDSIPELPEIPELKYEVTDEMNRLQHNSQDGDNNKEHKETPPGLSPDCKDGTVGRAPWDEAGEEDGYHDNMGAWGQHMQEGMEGGYPGAHQMPYPNQQQMWANFYGSGGGPPGGHHPPPLPPHMAMDPAGPGGWWQGHAGPAGPDLGPYRMGGPPGGPGMPPAPGPWALRGPRPRGERRGPGRPRLTNKGDPRGENRPRSAGLPGASQFPSPYPEGLPADMMGDHKRGPGRPKALLDPNSPKVPGDTTKNGNKKRYTCEVCQKRFSTAWYVRVHRRSHNGERPYVCNNCGKGFMLPNVLQVHLRKCEKNNPPGAGGGPGSQGSLDGEAPNQSPTSVSASGGPPGFRSGGYGGPEGAMGSCPPQSYPPPPGHTGGPPGPGPYNQRYLGGMGSPPFSSGMSGDTGGGGGMPPLTTGSSFPGDPYPSMPPPPHSPHNSGTMDRSPPQFSPMYSPNSNNLPINSDTSEHHFLANDKPRDKGGGPGAGGQILGSVEATRTAPAGVDPSLYCATSDTSFEDRTAAEDHIKTHRPFSCEMCDKRFSQKCNLVTHMRLHTGDKPYKCEFCDKRFTQKGNLDAHIKTHTKEKPFQCTLCSKRFAFKSYLQSHIRSHQNGCPDTDMEEEDLDSCKENAKMAKFDNDINGLADSCNEDCDEDDEDNDPDGLSPSSLSPPPLPQFGATIQHLNTKGLNSSPENDISKLTDSRQTVAMLQ